MRIVRTKVFVERAPIPVRIIEAARNLLLTRFIFMKYLVKVFNSPLSLGITTETPAIFKVATKIMVTREQNQSNITITKFSLSLKKAW